MFAKQMLAGLNGVKEELPKCATRFPLFHVTVKGESIRAIGWGGGTVGTDAGSLSPLSEPNYP